MRVFEKQKIVTCPMRDDLGFELFLKLESITVGNAAKAAYLKQSLLHILYNRMFSLF